MTGFSPTRMIGGRYVVLGGTGGAGGSVWRAADRVTGRQVVVAELHLPADPDERRLARERLLRVARAAGRLRDAGFVAIHDVVTDGDVDHIVTELVDARTLAERVASDGPLDEGAAAAIARQLAAALHAAHGAGIVHGDIGPHTVLLGPDGKVHLAGVGVAEAADPLRTTRDPAYLAPELRDGGQATPEADLWAFGATVHLALLGRPPAEGVVPEPGGGVLANTLVGLLQPAPRDRPAARQVVGALDAVRRMAGTDPGRGRRWWWAVTGAVLGLLVGLAAGFALAAPRIETLTYGPDGDVRFGGTAACLDAVPVAGAVVGAADCAGPHGAEIVASIGALGERFPGRDALVRLAAGGCGPAFDAVVERPRQAGRQLVALVPTRAAFDAGDRAVHCVVTGGKVG
jgi:eukaryotic-like serine/threonine-protein kinase